jgi:AcrR family transcriptional regulator
MDHDIDTRQRILAAATDVFVEKGLSGARMQEIADRARTNKAMLHYYFKSKENLYETVVSTVVNTITERLHNVLKSDDLPATERFRQFVSTYLDSLAEHSYMPRLIMLDILSGGTCVIDAFKNAHGSLGFMGGKPVLDMIEQGIRDGEFNQVDPRQTMVSLIGMVVFYFAAQPMLTPLLGLQDEDRSRFLTERKQNIMDILTHGVFVSRHPHETDPVQRERV